MNDLDMASFRGIEISSSRRDIATPSGEQECDFGKRGEIWLEV
jgi:hypothetical protein